jgi:hypothetical protein
MRNSDKAAPPNPMSTAARAAECEAKLIAAAATFAGRRDVNYSELARAADVSPYAAKTGTGRLRARGEWPYSWPVKGSKGGRFPGSRSPAASHGNSASHGYVPFVTASPGAVLLRIHGPDRRSAVDLDLAKRFCRDILDAWPDTRAAWSAVLHGATLPSLAAMHDDEEAA